LTDRPALNDLNNFETIQGLRYWPAVAVLCLGMLSSFYLYSIVVEREDAINQAGFVNNANSIATSFQREMDRNVGVMESLESLYASSVEVERHEFKQFVVPHLASHEDIQALEWIPRVRKNQKSLYEKMARIEGVRDFRITELDENGRTRDASSRKEYFPVFYIEPMEGNEEAMGFDLASHPVRLEALNLARDTGQMIASARVTLVQEKEDQYGVLMFMPVYRAGSDQNTVENLRESLEGFFLGVYRLDDFAEESMRTVDHKGINFVLVDENALPENRVLAHFRINEDKQGVLSSDGVDVLNSDRVKWKASLEFPGRLWSLHFYQSPYYVAVYGARSAWIVMAVGFPFSLLLAVYIFTTLRNTARIEGLVRELKKANTHLEREMAERKRVDKLLREKKVELERKNEELEAFMYMAAHDLRTPIVSIHGFFEILRRTLSWHFRGSAMTPLTGLITMSGR